MRDTTMMGESNALQQGEYDNFSRKRTTVQIPADRILMALGGT